MGDVALRRSIRNRTLSRALFIGCLVIGSLIAVWAYDPETYCVGDHWNPFCNGGVPERFGPAYFACSTVVAPNGEQCCKYEVWNHYCENPPPSIAKFFWYKGTYPGPCGSNEHGQWCPDMTVPGGGS